MPSDKYCCFDGCLMLTQSFDKTNTTYHHFSFYERDRESPSPTQKFARPNPQEKFSPVGTPIC